MGRVHANRVGVAVVQARRAQLRLLLLLDGLLVLVLLLLRDRVRARHVVAPRHQRLPQEQRLRRRQLPRHEHDDLSKREHALLRPQELHVLPERRVAPPKDIAELVEPVAHVRAPRARRVASFVCPSFICISGRPGAASGAASAAGAADVPAHHEVAAVPPEELLEAPEGFRLVRNGVQETRGDLVHPLAIPNRRVEERVGSEDVCQPIGLRGAPRGSMLRRDGLDGLQSRELAVGRAVRVASAAGRRRRRRRRRR
mmetsp:Transcript_12052/g.50686  ORF Transcript_12052/g.50686 Transcript_12052/m.50686 type:complete len:256 (+) Transcript_12052:1883-2650(+)